MATIYVNDVSSSSTSLSSGQSLDQSTTYTILVDGNYSQQLEASVYFYNGTGSFDWDSSYDGEKITTYSYWTAKGWMGPYTFETVSGGTASFGDAGPDSYGYCSAIKGTFANVPSSVSGIGVEYYDGSSWSSRYYWSCKKPVTLTTPNAPTVTLSGNIFNISWNACTGANGTGNISYQVRYGDSVNGYTAYTSSSTTNTSLQINRWITPTDSDITYNFYVTASYSGVSRTSTETRYTLIAPLIVWSNSGLEVTTSAGQVYASWNAASISNNYNSLPVQYTIVCLIRSAGYDGSEYTATTTSLSHTFTPPAYDTELFIQITAWADTLPAVKYSNSIYFTVNSAPDHYTVCCYIDGEWKQCVTYYYDGTSWIECVPYYYDGSTWQTCSF